MDVTVETTRRHRRSSSLVTIRTVAERAGVSMMTVSNVINGTGKVSAPTRALVRQAIRNTGYIPNLEARTLASGGSNRMAFIHFDYCGQQAPFLEQVLNSVLSITASFGIQLLLMPSKALTRKATEKLALSAVRSGMRGLLLTPPHAEMLTGSQVLSETRVAAIATAGAMPDMHTMRIDNRAATMALTEHFIRLGHRRIGFITGAPQHGDSWVRQAGFEDALRQAGIPVRPELIAGGEFTFESGRRAAQRLLDLEERPTAIIASNDDMAAGALWMGHGRGLKLPDDLSVAGFDDTPAAVKTWPPLTVIRQPIAEMVERAVGLLMEDAREAQPSAPRDEIFEHTLIERASTARCK